MVESRKPLDGIHSSTILNKTNFSTFAVKLSNNHIIVTNITKINQYFSLLLRYMFCTFPWLVCTCIYIVLMSTAFAVQTPYLCNSNSELPCKVSELFHDYFPSREHIISAINLLYCKNCNNYKIVYYTIL